MSLHQDEDLDDFDSFLFFSSHTLEDDDSAQFHPYYPQHTPQTPTKPQNHRTLSNSTPSQRDIIHAFPHSPVSPPITSAMALNSSPRHDPLLNHQMASFYPAPQYNTSKTAPTPQILNNSTDNDTIPFSLTSNLFKSEHQSAQNSEESQRSPQIASKPLYFNQNNETHTRFGDVFVLDNNFTSDVSINNTSRASFPPLHSNTAETYHVPGTTYIDDTIYPGHDDGNHNHAISRTFRSPPKNTPLYSSTHSNISLPQDYNPHKPLKPQKTHKKPKNLQSLGHIPQPTPQTLQLISHALSTYSLEHDTIKDPWSYTSDSEDCILFPENSLFYQEKTEKTEKIHKSAKIPKYGNIHDDNENMYPCPIANAFLHERYLQNELKNAKENDQISLKKSPNSPNNEEFDFFLQHLDLNHPTLFDISPQHQPISPQLEQNVTIETKPSELLPKMVPYHYPLFTTTMADTWLPHHIVHPLNNPPFSMKNRPNSTNPYRHNYVKLDPNFEFYQKLRQQVYIGYTQRFSRKKRNKSFYHVLAKYYMLHPMSKYSLNSIKYHCGTGQIKPQNLPNSEKIKNNFNYLAYMNIYNYITLSTNKRAWKGYYFYHCRKRQRSLYHQCQNNAKQLKTLQQLYSLNYLKYQVPVSAENIAKIPQNDQNLSRNERNQSNNGKNCNIALTYEEIKSITFETMYDTEIRNILSSNFPKPAQSTQSYRDSTSLDHTTQSVEKSLFSPTLRFDLEQWVGTWVLSMYFNIKYSTYGFLSSKKRELSPGNDVREKNEVRNNIRYLLLPVNHNHGKNRNQAQDGSNRSELHNTSNYFLTLPSYSIVLLFIFVVCMLAITSTIMTTFTILYPIEYQRYWMYNHTQTPENMTNASLFTQNYAEHAENSSIFPKNISFTPNINAITQLPNFDSHHTSPQSLIQPPTTPTLLNEVPLEVIAPTRPQSAPYLSLILYFSINPFFYSALLVTLLIFIFPALFALLVPPIMYKQSRYNKMIAINAILCVFLAFLLWSSLNIEKTTLFKKVITQYNHLYGLNIYLDSNNSQNTPNSLQISKNSTKNMNFQSHDKQEFFTNGSISRTLFPLFQDTEYYNNISLFSPNLTQMVQNYTHLSMIQAISQDEPDHVANLSKILQNTLNTYKLTQFILTAALMIYIYMIYALYTRKHAIMLYIIRNKMFYMMKSKVLLVSFFKFMQYIEFYNNLVLTERKLYGNSDHFSNHENVAENELFIEKGKIMMERLAEHVISRHEKSKRKYNIVERFDLDFNYFSMQDTSSILSTYEKGAIPIDFNEKQGPFNPINILSCNCPLDNGENTKKSKKKSKNQQNCQTEPFKGNSYIDSTLQIPDIPQPHKIQSNEKGDGYRTSLQQQIDEFYDYFPENDPNHQNVAENVQNSSKITKDGHLLSNCHLLDGDDFRDDNIIIDPHHMLLSTLHCIYSDDDEERLHCPKGIENINVSYNHENSHNYDGYSEGDHSDIGTNDHDHDDHDDCDTNNLPEFMKINRRKLINAQNRFKAYTRPAVLSRFHSLQSRYHEGNRVNTNISHFSLSSDAYHPHKQSSSHPPLSSITLNDVKKKLTVFHYNPYLYISTYLDTYQYLYKNQDRKVNEYVNGNHNFYPKKHTDRDVQSEVLDNPDQSSIYLQLFLFDIVLLFYYIWVHYLSPLWVTLTSSSSSSTEAHNSSKKLDGVFGSILQRIASTRKYFHRIYTKYRIRRNYKKNQLKDDGLTGTYRKRHDSGEVELYYKDDTHHDDGDDDQLSQDNNNINCDIDGNFHLDSNISTDTFSENDLTTINSIKKYQNDDINMNSNDDTIIDIPPSSSLSNFNTKMYITLAKLSYLKQTTHWLYFLNEIYVMYTYRGIAYPPSQLNNRYHFPQCPYYHPSHRMVQHEMDNMNASQCESFYRALFKSKRPQKHKTFLTKL